MKPLLVATVLTFLFAMYQWRRFQARKRLAQVDRGERCVACDATNMQREGRHTRCLRCNHVTDLVALGAASVNLHEIDEIARDTQKL